MTGKIMQKQKGISTLVGITIIVVIAAILFGGVFVYQYFATKSQTSATNVQNSNVQTAGWKTYTNTQYGFEFQYPVNTTIHVLDNGGIALDPVGSGNMVIEAPKVFRETPNGRIKTFNEFIGNYGQGYTKTVLTVGGIESVGVSSSQIGDIVYVPLAANQILEIGGNFKDSTFNKIISTFKFTK
jgi:hypothetical protein